MPVALQRTVLLSITGAALLLGQVCWAQTSSTTAPAPHVVQPNVVKVQSSMTNTRHNTSASNKALQSPFVSVNTAANTTTNSNHAAGQEAVTEPGENTTATQPQSTAVTTTTTTTPQPLTNTTNSTTNVTTTATPPSTTTTPAANSTIANPAATTTNKQATTSNNAASTAAANFGTSVQALQEITNVAMQAVLAVYNYDYRNMQTKLSQAKQYFTKTGYESFYDALQKSDNMSIIKEKKLTVGAVSQGRAQVVLKKMLQGKPVWVVKMPFKVTYIPQSGQVVTQLLDATVVVARKGNNGQFGVNQIIVKPVQKTQPATGASTTNETSPTTSSATTSTTPSTSSNNPQQNSASPTTQQETTNPMTNQ